MKLLISIYRQA